MEPPPKRRLPTVRAFAPAPGSAYEIDAVLRDFEAVGEEYRACLAAARGLDLRRVRVRSPASRLLRFPLGGYIRGQTAHERRHLWQAGQVISDPRFPR